MTEPADIRLLRRGKVRDIYEVVRSGVRTDMLLVVATDRMSALDWSLRGIQPQKCLVLTAMTQFWHEVFKRRIPTDLVAWKRSDLPGPAGPFAGRALLVRKLQMINIECVVRGYLYGSAFQEYISSGTVCSTSLPAGLRKADRLPAPIFTPALKSAHGPDLNLSVRQMEDIVGRDSVQTIREYALSAYSMAAGVAEGRGLILADTKFEFGRIGDEIVLGDELVTPDSSRLWFRDSWCPGEDPLSLDRQSLKDWLLHTGWDRRCAPPPVPAARVMETADLYVRAYELISGETLAQWLQRSSS